MLLKEKKRFDYYAFGMEMPGRKWAASNYRYGMNGQESEPEIVGSAGSIYSAEYWMYDARLGRRWNIDPVTIAWASPYSTFFDNPIYYNDPSGLTPEEGGGGGNGGGKTDPNFPLNKGGNAIDLPEIEISAKGGGGNGFWSKVGNFFSNLWSGFVKFDKKLDDQINKNDWTPPQKSNWISGEMPFGDGPNKGNSIQGNAYTKIRDNNGINAYTPGSILGGSSESKIGTVMGTGTRGVTKFLPASGTKGILEAGHQGFEVGDNIGETVNTYREEAGSTKLKTANANSTAQKVQQTAKQVMKAPEPPVLIYYTLQTDDGFTTGTKQATQKDYKQVIKQLESKGYTIDSFDRQLGK